MIFRYFKVYVYDLPKKIPADAKLYVRTIYGEGVNRDLKWVEETSYQGFFKYKEGSLNDGFREVLSKIAEKVPKSNLRDKLSR